MAHFVALARHPENRAGAGRQLLFRNRPFHSSTAPDVLAENARTNGSAFAGPPWNRRPINMIILADQFDSKQIVSDKYPYSAPNHLRSEPEDPSVPLSLR